MLEHMDYKSKEYAKHHETIKRAWIKWGKSQAQRGQRVVQCNERANYGSNFQSLGAQTRAKSLGSVAGPVTADRHRQYYNMTEQQFLMDPSSESDNDQPLVEAPPVVRAPVKRRVVQESSRSDVEGEDDDLERDE